MKKIAIYTLFDNNYFDNGASLLYSFFKFNDWFNGDFFVINDDKYCILSDENKKKLKTLFPYIKFLDIKSEDYKDVLENQDKIVKKKAFLSCFYKLEIFKGKYDRVLLLDSDMIIRDNIKELFEDESYNGKFCACLDSQVSRETYVKRGPKDYFNGGVYVVDKEVTKKYPYEVLRDFCATTTEGQLSSSPRTRGKGQFVDQDCLNYFLKDEDVLILPSSMYNGNHCLKEKGCGGAKIFHYYGPFNKPNGSMDKRGMDKWFFDPWHKMHNEVMEKLNG